MKTSGVIFFLVMVISACNSIHLRAKAKQGYASSQLIIKDINGQLPDLGDKLRFIDFITSQPDKCKSDRKFDFNLFSSRSVCQGDNKSIGIIVSVNFCLVQDDTITFHVVGDFGKGAISYFNNDSNNSMSYQNYSASQLDNEEAWIIVKTLPRGQHQLNIIAGEDCCDGDGQIFYKTLRNSNPRAVNFDHLSAECDEYDEHASTQLTIKNTDGAFPDYKNIQVFHDYIISQPERCKSKNKFSFETFNSRIVCGGSNFNTGFIIEIKFCNLSNQEITFHIGADFGKGGIAYFNDDISSAEVHGEYWSSKWNSDSSWTLSKNLPRGKHNLTIIGGEDCCDGDGQIYYKTTSNPTPRVVDINNLYAECKELGETSSIKT